MAAAQAPHAVTVKIAGALQPPGFVPAVLAIHVGDLVIFSNTASPPATYKVAAADGSFTSPALLPNQHWGVTFSHPGTHLYHDKVYARQMVGEVDVVDQSVVLLPAPDPKAEATEIAHLRRLEGAGAAQDSFPWWLAGLIGALVLSMGAVGIVFVRRRYLSVVLRRT